MRKHNGYSTLGKVGFFATLALTIAIFVCSQVGLGQVEGSRWLLLGLGSGAVFIGGLGYWVSVIRELRSRVFGQHLLGGLGLLTLTGFASWQSIALTEGDSWWLAASVCLVLLAGEWYFTALKARVGELRTDFAGLLPEFADVLVEQEVNRVRVGELEVGDIVLVRPGSVIPADGVVVQGSSVVDESSLTGETVPVPKGEGSPVYAGSSNASSKKSNKALTIRVTAIGGDLLVRNFARRVDAVAAERLGVDALSGELTSGLFVLTLASAFVGGGLWLVLDATHWQNAILCAASVLLAVNLAVVSDSSGLVSSLVASVAGAGGVLVRARTALYRIRKSHVVVLNLVGTLTTGEPKLVDIHLAKGTSLGSANEVLAVAAAADVRSDHPLARVILAECSVRNTPSIGLYEVESHRFGVSARMDGSSVLVGSAGILTSNNVPIDVQDLVKVATANENGNSVVYVVIDNLLVGYLEFSDGIRETAREAVRQLQLQRKRVVAITGEATGVAEAVCKSLGITEVFAEVVHSRKLELIDELRADDSIITVVGDPLDDSELLAKGDVGIALGVGGELGSESAELLVISNEPRAVSRMMVLARRSTRTLNLALVLVTLLDVVALGLAGFFALPLLSAGIVLGSTLLAGNSIWRLRR